MYITAMVGTLLLHPWIKIYTTHPVTLKCLFSGQPVLHVNIHLHSLSSTQFVPQALTMIPDKHISTSASCVSPQTVQAICAPQAINHSSALKYTDMHAHTLSLLPVVELLWATPWWQAIFEVALSRASSSQLYKKRPEEEEKEKYQPVIYWWLSQFLSYLLKACLARYKLLEPPFFFLIKTITMFFWL